MSDHPTPRNTWEGENCLMTGKRYSFETFAQYITDKFDQPSSRNTTIMSGLRT